jgi:hypothetical protein
MLLDACRQGIFAHHPGRYALRVVDALQPERALAADLLLTRQPGRPLRAVFLNYLLDCLPAAVLEVGDDAVRQLCVRTCLARGVHLAEHTDLSAEQLTQRIGSADPRHEADLLAVYGLFASEYDYRPVDIRQVPYGDFAVALSRAHNVRRVLHNYGAIQCLERLLGLVRDDGFILANDYGPTQLAPAEEYEHQHFSEATFIGVNFPLLKAYFTDAKPHRWSEPAGERESIHARLLGHQPAPETVARFEECFGKAAWERVEEPARRARELLRTGRLEAAASAFRQALAGQPHNWVLLNEVALFLTFPLRDARAGADLA